MRAKGVPHVHNRGRLAHRAVLRRSPPHAAGGPQQLGMGVADVDPRQAAAAELAEDGVAGEAVVDLAGETLLDGACWGAGREVGPEAHGGPG